MLQAKCKKSLSSVGKKKKSQQNVSKALTAAEEAKSKKTKRKAKMQTEKKQVEEQNKIKLHRDINLYWMGFGRKDKVSYLVKVKTAAIVICATLGVLLDKGLSCEMETDARKRNKKTIEGEKKFCKEEFIAARDELYKLGIAGIHDLAVELDVGNKVDAAAVYADPLEAVLAVQETVQPCSKDNL
jgi:hypothetical protein